MLTTEAELSNTFAFTGDEPWAPRFFTKPLSKRTKGDFIIRMAESWLIARDGMRAGQPLRLAEWQKTLIRNVAEMDENDAFRYRKCLIMVPRKNGKTFLMAIFIIYHLLTAPANAEIYSAGKDRGQAEIVFNMVKFFIESSPILRQRFQLIKSKHKWVNKKTQAFYMPLSADAGKTHGINPFFIVADELHVWEGLGDGKRAKEFWDGLVTGSGARPNSQMLIISTAGSNPNSILGNLYKDGKDIAEGIIENPYFGFFCWEADPTQNPTEPETWYSANPNLAEGLLNEDAIREAMMLSGATGMAGFLRLYLNIWASQEGEPFVNQVYWAEATWKDYEIAAGARVTIGFDGSQTADTTCIIIQEIETGFIQIIRLWEKDEKDPLWAVNREEVEETLKQVYAKYDVALMWVDAAYWIPDVRRWQKKYKWQVTEVPPVDSRMAPIAMEFNQDLIEGNIHHGNDRNLNRYVENAILRENGSFGKKSRKLDDRIDALVASVLANGARKWVIAKDQKQVQRAVSLGWD